MSERPSRKVAVILERQAVQSRWESHHWEVAGALPDVGGETRVIVDTADVMSKLYPGFEVTLFPDEAEGYFLNITSEAPSVFVAVRKDEATGEPYPFQATLSYNEAARWMDGSEWVERAVIWPELAAWMGEWVEANYRPEPKKRRKPRSFEGKGTLREKNEP